jgi:hypothetical protein
MSKDTCDLNKDTAGKIPLSWTMRSLMEAVSSVRVYGNNKYKTNAPHNWKQVNNNDWYDAALRHLMAAIEAERGNGSAVDAESGLAHLWHCACCLMFLIENRKGPLKDGFPIEPTDKLRDA